MTVTSGSGATLIRLTKQLTARHPDLGLTDLIPVVGSNWLIHASSD